jgi:hypothetical protein
MPDTPSADAVSKLLALRHEFEALGESESLAIQFTYHNSFPSDFAVREVGPPTRDRFHRLAIQAGRLVTTIPAAERFCPGLAAERTPAGKWFRLLFGLTADSVYFFDEEGLPAWRVRTPGPRRAGQFFYAVQLSLKAIDRLALLAEEEAGGSLSAPTGDEREKERQNKVIHALACLATIGPNATHIAKEVGVPRGTLLGWPEFRERYDQAKTDSELKKRSRRRGRRSGDRDFEANKD